VNVRRASTGRAWSTAIAAALLMSVSACGGTTATDQASDNRGSDDDTAGSSTTDAASSEPEPLFADEFDTSGSVDWDVWQPIIEKRHDSRQTDREKNVRVEGGNLVIEAHKEQYKDAEYTSAMIQTKGWFSTDGSELDEAAVEGTGGVLAGQRRPVARLWRDRRDGAFRAATKGDPNRWVTSVNLLHSPAAIEALTDWGRATSTPVDVTEWHTYAVEWAEGEIRFFIDDEQTAVHERPDGDEPTWPFDDHPEVIVFDMFMGAYAGPVDADALPQKLLLDWVRAWPLEDS
jgi:beta-glucanase (GH16 family)